jgi:aminoglycoside phosphotransferase (APT) family kinase protein
MDAENAAAAIANHLPAARLRAAKRLKGGVSADVFRLDLTMADGVERSIVLRAMGKSGLESAQEYALLSALHAAGLPIPHPICADDSRSHIDAPFLLMEFIEGVSEIPPDLAGTRLEVMADALASIHQISTASLPPLPSRLDPWPELPGFLPQGAEWQALRDHVAKPGPGPFTGVPVLLHGDFWPQNLIWRDDRIAAILDWEDAALGDPLSDLACALLELKYLFDDALVDRFYQAYRRHARVDPHRLAHWQLYVASAAQHHMGAWGLEPTREDHMRQTALRQIREAAAALGIVGLSRPGSSAV